jgi:hypothetical protein
VWTIHLTGNPNAGKTFALPGGSAAWVLHPPDAAGRGSEAALAISRREVHNGATNRIRQAIATITISLTN